MEPTQNEFGMATPYAVIDIETCYASKEDIDAEMAAWKPHANTKDPGKIEQQRLAALASAKEDSALLDVAPMSCIGLAIASGRYMLNGLSMPAKNEITGFQVVNCGGEKEMLVTLRATLDSQAGPGTVLVGHNIKGFDLPKLRARYLFHRLRMPAVLYPAMFHGKNQPMFDTMQEFSSYFTAQRSGDKFISLDDMSRMLKLDVPVKVIHGSEIPRLAEEGKVDEVLLHCAVDVMAEEQCWNLLNGSQAAASWQKNSAGTCSMVLRQRREVTK